MPFGERRTSVWCLSTESEDLSGRVSGDAALERRGSSDRTGRMEKKGAMAGDWSLGEWFELMSVLLLKLTYPLWWCPQA